MLRREYEAKRRATRIGHESAIAVTAAARNECGLPDPDPPSRLRFDASDRVGIDSGKFLHPRDAIPIACVRRPLHATRAARHFAVGFVSHSRRAAPPSRPLGSRDDAVAVTAIGRRDRATARAPPERELPRVARSDLRAAPGGVRGEGGTMMPLRRVLTDPEDGPVKSSCSAGPRPVRAPLFATRSPR